MIRLLLTAAVVGGLLQRMFGEQPARRKGNAKRAHPKAKARRVRSKAAGATSVSR